MKKSETISLALEIEEKINDDDIKDVIDKIAYKNALSIWVFDTDNNLIYSSVLFYTFCFKLQATLSIVSHKKMIFFCYFV